MPESRPGSNPLRDPQDRRLTRIAGPSALVLFGVTGDLARKKLLPAIYDLANRGLLPPSFSLVGFGRRDWSDTQFTEEVRTSVEASARTEFNETVWDQLRGGFRFVSGGFDDADAYQNLGSVLEELEGARGTGGNTVFYLSIPPDWFEDVSRQLADQGLAGRTGEPIDGRAATDVPWRRVVIEKPFGHDLASARELNEVIEQVFDPDAVFRICLLYTSPSPRDRG